MRSLCYKLDRYMIGNDAARMKSIAPKGNSFRKER